MQRTAPALLIALSFFMDGCLTAERRAVLNAGREFGVEIRRVENDAALLD